MIPKLENFALHAGPETSSKSPIILIHGAFCDGRMWEGNFLTWFAEKGHPVYAIHLKGLTDQGSVRTLWSWSLNSYAARLAELVKQIDQPPVLIGHSLGGLVIQRFLTDFSEEVKGACLLASLPPFGMKHTILGMLKKPGLLLKYVLVTLFPAIARKGKAPAGLLSDRVPPEDRKHFSSLIVRESVIALFNAMKPGIKVERVSRVPLQVWGAGLDNLALPEDVKRMASIYQTNFRFRQDMGHFMVMEPGWQDIARDIEVELCQTEAHS